jgi:flagella basal body P-ring formation protein FlgA
VIGQAARRPLRAGAAVALHDVSPPQVIKRDDMISVAFQADGLKLVLQAKALSAAAVGDVFMAVNPGSKKEIQVVATGPGQAAVGPEADRLRANLRANPQFLASLR